MPTTRTVAFVITLLLASIAAPAHGAFSGTDVFLPSVGRAAGISNWYTTVWVHNPGTVQATAQFTFLVRDQVNTSATAVTRTIAAGATVKYANAMTEIFGREGFGAIRVMSNQKLVVNSRIYARATSETDTSSKGQFFAGVPASFAIGTGQKSQLLGVFQTQPSASSAFRYNFGFVETTGQDCTVRVTPRSPTGAVLATGKSYPVRRLEQRQFQFKDEFASLSTDNARLEVEVTAGNGRVIAFGSGIANGSSDPSTFEMSFRDDLLAENASGSGTITGVTAGNGLTGGGTTGTVTLNVGAGAGISVTPDGIALADAGVTKAKLAASGGLAGQVLAFDGSNLVWQTPSGGGGGLTLPYEGAATTSGDAFKVRNTGAGVAVTGATASTLGSLGLALYGVAGQSLVSGGAGVRGSFGPGNDGSSGALGTETFGAYGVSTNCGGEAGGVRGYSACTGNTGTIGSPTAGVLGTSDNMHGVLGRQGTGSSTPAPSHAGVWGDSTNGPGVYGSSAAGNGVEGYGGMGGYGVVGGGANTGVYGSGGSQGVWGNSGSGAGVRGQSDSVGVIGTSTNGIGVSGGSTNGEGVYGGSTSTYGVHGMSSNGDGVFAEAYAGGKSGLFAVNDNPAGYAAFMRGNASRHRDAQQGRRGVPHRPPARPREQGPAALLRRVAGHDEHLQRQRRHRRPRRGDRRAAGVLRGAQPRLPLPAHRDRRVRPGHRRQRDHRQPLRHPHRQGRRQGLLAGHRDPQGPVGRGEPHRRRAGQARGRTGPLPPPGGVRPAAGEGRRNGAPSRGDAPSA